jgi:hypothetical protein
MIRFAAPVILALALSACGGGGGARYPDSGLLTGARDDARDNLRVALANAERAQHEAFPAATEGDFAGCRAMANSAFAPLASKYSIMNDCLTARTADKPAVHAQSSSRPAAPSPLAGRTIPAFCSDPTITNPHLRAECPR